MKTVIRNTFCALIFALCIILSSCDPNAIDPTPNPTGDTVASLRGMYVLCEGGYNMDNASLDFLDFSTGVYTLDTFALANRDMDGPILGDVANDMIIYGTKAYIAVNGSGLVEVLDARTARHLGAVMIPNCRRLLAHDGKVYVSYYAGRVIDENHQLGCIATIDTVAFTVCNTQEVGYQPEGMAIMGNSLYVANSGGYVGMNTGEYDNRLTQLDWKTYGIEKNIEVAPNLQDVIADPHQPVLWVSSFGNYYDVPANLYKVNPEDQGNHISYDIPVSDMVLDGDTLFIVASSYDANWNMISSFYKMSTRDERKIELNLSATFTAPNSIAVNPVTRDIYVTDAGDYVNPGTLYCFSPDGKEKWHVRTGVIPGRICFVR